MSSIRPGDEELHFCDGSHRWSGGPADDRGQETWQARLRFHLEEHQQTIIPRRRGATDER